MIKKFLYIIFLLLSLNSNIFSITPYRVLIIHSYKPSYIWTTNIEKGVVDTFNSSELEIEVFIEYIDSINTIKKPQFQLLFQIFENRYNSITFDAIIATDNDAFDFVKQYRSDLWKDTPIIFCGLNGYTEDMLDGFDNVTGVVENIDVKKTIDLVFDQRPNINNVLIWGEEQNDVETILKNKQPNINIIYANSKHLDEDLKEYQNLKSDDVIILSSVLRDENGHIYPTDKTAQLISNMSEAPTYALHDIFLGHGIVGGYLVSGQNQGVSAAKYVLEILRGVNIETLPIIKESTNQYMFDDSQLYRFKIPTATIPLNSLIVNSRPSFYSRYSVIIRIIILLILTIIIVISIKFTYNFRLQSIRESHLLHQRSALFDLSKDLLCITDKNGIFKQLNQSWVDILGWEKEELKGQNVVNFVHPDDIPRTKEVLHLALEGNAFKDFKIRYRCKNGSYRWLSWDSYPFKSESDTFAVARDVTVEKKHNEELEHQASFDELTGVHNRRSIMEYMEIELQRSIRYSLNLGILMIDIDNFKNFNDQYGHLNGDEILKEITKISESILRAADMMGRYGGEEFIIVLPESNKEASMVVAERIRKAIGLADFSNNKSVTISVGCTEFNNDKNITQIIKRADEALYISKNSGRNRVSFK